MCGRKDVDQMLSEMTPGEFEEWMIRDEIEPIGNKKLLAVLALLGSHLATCLGFNFHPSRFYPASQETAEGHDEISEPMSDAEMALAFGRLAEQ